MAGRNYQYETSPKKLKQNYKKPQVKTVKKSKKKVKEKWKLKTATLVMFVFLILFVIIYRNSMINESFAKILALKSEATEMQKENNQLEIGIQNSLNLNNIEQSARDLLGMEKLTSKQILYIGLSKKDYVEPKLEEVKLSEDKGFIDSIIEKIKNIF